MVASGEYRGALADGPVRGRGAALNPGNRFDPVSLHVLGEHLDLLTVEHHEDTAGRQVATQVYRDTSRSVINRIDSPDIPMDWSINPYRGCEHGCIYCYARPTHEMLSMSCGLDFETKILAKVDAPKLLRRELGRPGWSGQPIMMSGVTDCYQPVESKLKITRQCLQVLAEARQPVGIVTKSRLILRDLDLLTQLSRCGAVKVAVSLTTLDNDLAAKMEPRAASPRDRLWTMRRLASAGVAVSAMVAPVIPAINDRQVPAILKAAADAGATSAGYVLVRLPYQIKDLFEDWLARHMPQRQKRVQRLIRQARGGKLYEAEWGTRMCGQGAYARQIGKTFELFAARYGLTNGHEPMNTGAFRRPRDSAQMSLFDDD